MTITLVVEDGSGHSDANVYGAAADVDAYHASRGNAYWANVSDVEVKKACIVRATDYIDLRFGDKFRGRRLTRDQALAWPRLSSYDNDNYSLDGVPQQVFKAMCEYALRAAMYNRLAPDAPRLAPAQDMTATDPNAAAANGTIVGPIRQKTERVGPLEESTTYDSTYQLAQLARSGADSRSVQSVVVSDIYVPQYPEADLLLEGVIENAVSATLVMGG